MLTILTLKPSFLLLCLLLLTGCLNQAGVIADKNAQIGSASKEKYFPGFLGCLKGTALDTSRIKVEYEFPSAASEIFIKRNGVVVFSSKTKTLNSFIDIGLSEQDEYEYACEASVDAEIVTGTQKLYMKTLTGNAPNFSGIKDISESADGDKLTVNWSPTSGPKVSYFKIYANPGASVDWSLPAIKTVPSDGKLSYQLVNNRTSLQEGVLSAATFEAAHELIQSRLLFGDGIQYQFGMRACTDEDVCDSNTKSIQLSTGRTQLKSAPVSPGIKTLKFTNGRLLISAPWSHLYGNIKTRRVYYRKKVLGAWTSWNESTLVTNLAPRTGNEATSISLERPENGKTFEENTDYEFKIIDFNENNGSNAVYSRIVGINSGDLTPPVFSGLTSVTPGSNAGLYPETSAKFNFTASSSGDVDKYEIYYSLGFGGNACNSGSLLYSVSANGFSGASSITVGVGDPSTDPTAAITLLPRTQYTFCMKAVDTAQNSTGVVTVNYNTKDLTPPYFNRPKLFLSPGLTSAVFDRDTKSLVLTWGAAIDSDVKNYKINLWQGAESQAGLLPADGVSSNGFIIKNVLVNHPLTSTSVPLPMNDITPNQMIYISLAACDDAGVTTPAYNTTNNCSGESLIETWSGADAFQFFIGDITAPQGFPGIKTASLFIDKNLDGIKDTDETGHGGTATISWDLPASISDFSQFEVVHIDASYNIIRLPNSVTGRLVNCAEVSGVWTCPQSTVLRNLDQYRRYRFHVIAKDASGNPTEDPALKFLPLDNEITTKTLDEVNPVFATNQNGVADSGFKFKQITSTNIVFEWVSATDNQYEPGSKVYYEVYRKKDSSFSVSTLNTATQVVNLPNTFTHSESKSSLVQGDTYYYLVCARDESGNRSCPGSAVAYTIPDTTAPLLSLVKARTTDNTSAKTLLDKNWILTWNLSDNSALTNTQVIIFYKRSELSATSSQFTLTDAQVTGTFNSIYGTESTPALPSGVNYVVSAPGATSCSSIVGGSSSGTASDQRLNCILGPSDNTYGKKEWFSYYVVARDSQGLGNFSSTALSVFSDSDAALTVESDNRVIVTKVVPEYMGRNGSTKLLIEGKDFANNITVDLVNPSGTPSVVPCTNIEYLTTDLITCEIGDYSGSLISTLDYVVTITNTDGSKNQPNVLMKVRSTTDANVSKCASAANAGSSPFHQGDGTSGNPYIICTAAQMVSVMGSTSYWDKNFKVGAHLNFSGISSSSIEPIGQFSTTNCVTTKNVPFSGSFDGGGYLIQNYQRDFLPSHGCRVGVFGFVGKIGSVTAIKNIIFHNLQIQNLTANDSGLGDKAMGVIGFAYNSEIQVLNIKIMKSIIKSDSVSVDEVGGFFGTMMDYSYDHKISDIVLDDVSVTGKELVGGMFGSADIRRSTSYIRNLYLNKVTVLANGTNATYGSAVLAAKLTGYANTEMKFFKIENSSVTCTAGAECAGISSNTGTGLVLNNLIMNNNTITLTGNTPGEGGGLIAYANIASTGKLKMDNVSINNLTINSGKNVGSLVGYLNGSPCTPNSGTCGLEFSNISIQNFTFNQSTGAVGGFVGYVHSTQNVISVKNSSLRGGVFNLASGNGGGLIGQILGNSVSATFLRYIDFSDVFVGLEINSNTTKPGAFFGTILDSSSGYSTYPLYGYKIKNVVSVISRTTGSQAIDGFIGVPGTISSQAAAAASFTNNYWDETTSSDTTAQAFGSLTLTDAMLGARTTLELSTNQLDATTYVDWDFTNVWKWHTQYIYPLPIPPVAIPNGAPSWW